VTGYVHRAAFRAMSTTIEMTGVGVSARDVARAAESGRRLAAAWDDRFSRFRPDSQLSRLNAAVGAAVPVDAEFLDLLAAAKHGVHRTAGRFNPAVLPALEAAGYRQSIERLRVQPSHASEPPPPADVAGWNLVALDRDRGEARLPPGMRIDLGGIAKGAFVDRLAAMLAAWPGGCVDAGGDLRVWGMAPQGERWRIGIEIPTRPAADLLVAEVLDPAGIAVATSGTHRRQWRMGDQIVNHLIDPRTSNPIAGAIAATAFARTVTAAEVATKALIVSAAKQGDRALFGARFAVVIRDDGSTAVMIEEPKDVPSISITIAQAARHAA
jgi:FAD:protein FMN transferase